MGQWLGAIGFELLAVGVVAALVVVGLILIAIRPRSGRAAYRKEPVDDEPVRAPARRAADGTRSDPFSTARLTVLDSVVVDDERRLVLIRRDRVEHLLLVGGPTDVVVESRIADHPEYDTVARERQQALGDENAGNGGAHAIPHQARLPDLGAYTDENDAAGTGDEEAALDDAVAEPRRGARIAAAPVIPSPAGQRPAEGAGPGASAFARPHQQHQQQPSATRREPADLRTRPAEGAAAFEASDSEVEATPAARVEPLLPLGNAAGPAAAQPQRAASAALPGTTLGDLAERLEEALAREVRTNQSRNLELDLDEFELDLSEVYEEEAATSQPAPQPIRTAGSGIGRAPEGEPRRGQPVEDQRISGPRAVGHRSESGAAPAQHPGQPSPHQRSDGDAHREDPHHPESRQPEPRAPEPRVTEARSFGSRGRQDDRVRPMERPGTVSSAQEAEARRAEQRMQAERQDDPPVISLSSRRRENADPLEDEMARLLGELTGDGTTRR